MTRQTEGFARAFGEGMGDMGASLRDRAGGPTDLSRCASQPKALIPCADTAKRVAAAIDADLLRQCRQQSGCQYEPADECGVAVATMNIVPLELARAALTAIATEARGEGA